MNDDSVDSGGEFDSATADVWQDLCRRALDCNLQLVDALHKLAVALAYLLQPADVPDENDVRSFALLETRPMTAEHARRIFGLGASYSREELRSAFLRLLIRYHPDQGLTELSAADVGDRTRITRAILEARDVLLKLDPGNARRV